MRKKADKKIQRNHERSTIVRKVEETLCFDTWPNIITRIYNQFWMKSKSLSLKYLKKRKDTKYSIDRLPSCFFFRKMFYGFFNEISKIVCLKCQSSAFGRQIPTNRIRLDIPRFDILAFYEGLRVQQVFCSPLPDFFSQLRQYYVYTGDKIIQTTENWNIEITSPYTAPLARELKGKISPR